ncbi:MAG: dTDP-4-amino-4,6-dideoxygalactose transaminase [Chitinophagales bacterium]
MLHQNIQINRDIPFNKAFQTGKETDYIRQAVASGKLSGDGMFTKKCHAFFEQKYSFRKALLTTSCTDALEMCALLLNIEKGDEVIIPSYNFVSAANAFALRGAKIVFADSRADNPNIDETILESLITERTKAIVVVHYAGVACEMEKIMQIAEKHNVFVIEDAAHAIDSFYDNKSLGSIGHLATFSFHDTKNVIAGEGGMLVINDERFAKRAEIIREKGTNRAAFYRGEVDKYQWVDIGSSFLPSELIAAFLFAQLEHLEQIQAKRVAVWQRYYDNLKALPQQVNIKLPQLPQHTTCNGHLFYLVCENLEQRTQLIDFLRAKDIYAVFHYISLHDSPYFEAKHDGRLLPQTQRYTDCLVRLPLYYELSMAEVDYVCQMVFDFFAQ